MSAWKVAWLPRRPEDPHPEINHRRPVDPIWFDWGDPPPNPEHWYTTTPIEYHQTAGS